MEKGLKIGLKSRLKMPQNMAKNCLQNRPEPRAKASKEFVQAFKSGVYQFACLHLQPLVISSIASWHSETRPQDFQMVVQLFTLHNFAE